MSKPSACLFDFDGVIVDSLFRHVMAWDKALQEIVGRPLQPDERRLIVGRSTAAIANLLTIDPAGNRARPELARLLAERKREVLTADQGGVPLLPGVAATFAFLRAEKIPYGIASNAPGAFVRQTVTKLGLQVPVVLGCEDVVDPKPAPDLYLLCAKRLGISIVDHGSVLVFEDSTHGIDAGVQAGMTAIGVMTQHDAATLKGAGASFVCYDLAEPLAKGWFRNGPTAG